MFTVDLDPTKSKRAVMFFLLLVGMVLGACTSIANPSPTGEIEVTPGSDVEEEYFFSRSLPFDAIPPIYEPEFLPAEEAPLIDEELVMGVSIEGQAKAYPVSVLRFREMVDDELAGWPILVSW